MVLISGTADLNSILTGVLKQLGSLLINAGLNQLAGPAGSGGILSFLGFGTRADGGTVMPGNTYMVGERGPELLKLNDNGSGQVINNNQLSSAMNRYRPSGSTSGNQAFGDQVDAGGASNTTSNGAIDVRYTVERINNVDYVTAAEFQQGMQQAAEQGATRGENRALAKLRNSPGTRRRIGL